MNKGIIFIMLGMILSPLQLSSEQADEVDKWSLVPKIQKINPSLELEKARLYSEQILIYCRQYNLSPLLVLAIIGHESRFNEKAESVTDDYGPMQVNKWWLKKLKVSKASLQNIKNGVAAGTLILAIKKQETPNKACWWSVYNSRNPKFRKEYEFHIKRVLGIVGVEADCSGVKSVLLRDWDTWYRKRARGKSVPAGFIAATTT